MSLDAYLAAARERIEKDIYRSLREDSEMWRLIKKHKAGQPIEFAIRRTYGGPLIEETVPINLDIIKRELSNA